MWTRGVSAHAGLKPATRVGYVQKEVHLCVYLCVSVCVVHGFLAVATSSQVCSPHTTVTASTAVPTQHSSSVFLRLLIRAIVCHWPTPTAGIGKVPKPASRSTLYMCMSVVWTQHGLWCAAVATNYFASEHTSGLSALVWTVYRAHIYSWLVSRVPCSPLCSLFVCLFVYQAA